MPSLHRKLLPAPWPIWLLVFAWFCANCPQTLICTTIVWLGEARSFSHQQRLKSDLAHLLSGEKSHSLLSHVSTLPAAPVKSSLPPLPSLKKIDLAAEAILGRLAPPPPSPVRASAAHHAVSALRASPLHGPPRAVVAT